MASPAELMSRLPIVALGGSARPLRVPLENITRILMRVVTQHCWVSDMDGMWRSAFFVAWFHLYPNLAGTRSSDDFDALCIRVLHDLHLRPPHMGSDALLRLQCQIKVAWVANCKRSILEVARNAMHDAHCPVAPL